MKDPPPRPAASCPPGGHADGNGVRSNRVTPGPSVCDGTLARVACFPTGTDDRDAPDGACFAGAANAGTHCDSDTARLTTTLEGWWWLLAA